MRETLFKAKQRDNYEWVEGYYVKGRWYLEDRDIFVIIPTDVCFYLHCEIDEYIEVDSETVCQYTGRTDKNNVKIFENDIVLVKCYHSYKKAKYLPCVVKYVNGTFVVVGAYGSQFIGYLIDIEVIGNIYDNPELLTGGTEESK